MKRFVKRMLALGLGLSMLAPCGVYAAHPAGYWPGMQAYQQAWDAGDKNAMITTGEALLNYYAGLPMDTDTAGVRYNVYYNTYAIYEGMGKLEKAKEALQGVIDTGTYLGFTDAVIMAKERLRKIDPKAEVYTATTTAQAPYYGAKNEPKTGVLHGRCYTEGGESAMQNDSIISFYVELGSGHNSAQDYAWKIDTFDNGSRAILINLNFPSEGNTVSQVNNGSLDGEINETLNYLATLKSPVFLRIGGEMNVWMTQTTPEAFKQAYTRIANMARQKAPNAALVFSPSYASRWGGEMEPYFPDASLVDWVGASLYNNKYQNANSPSSAGDTNDMYFGLNQYADPVKNLEHTVDLAKKYNKPVIVTESGSGYALPSGGEDLSAFAANRTTELYSTLTMVYPQVKAILHFNNNMGGYRYALEGNATVHSAYQNAIAQNPTFVSSFGAAAPPTYVPLSQAKGLNGSSVTLRAYCDVPNQAVTVTYTLDGTQVGSSNAMPFSYTLNVASLTTGNHTLQVKFAATNGYSTTKTYTVTKDASGLISFAQQ